VLNVDSLISGVRIKLISNPVYFKAVNLGGSVWDLHGRMLVYLLEVGLIIVIREVICPSCGGGER